MKIWSQRPHSIFPEEDRVWVTCECCQQHPSWLSGRSLNSCQCHNTWPSCKSTLHYNSILQWRHNGHDAAWLRRRSKKISKFRITGLCQGNPHVASGSPHKGPMRRKYFHLVTSACTQSSQLEDHDPIEEVIVQLCNIAGVIEKLFRSISEECGMQRCSNTGSVVTALLSWHFWHGSNLLYICSLANKQIMDGGIRR